MLLVLAVIFGLLAFVLTYQQIEAEKRRISGDSETAILIQVTRNMVEGETLTEKDVARYTVKRRREAMANSREIPWSQLYKVVNHKLDTSINRGQILQTTDLKFGSRRNGFSGIVQDGWRAVSIPVDPVSSVNNLIQPNDNVDVIGTFRFPDVRGDSALDTVTLTILQDVKVLAVGNRWQTALAESGPAGSYGTVTLQLMPDEVEMLIFASQKGKITLSLRNFEDTRISRDIEKRSVNFKLLEKDIPNYNMRREERRNRRLK
jgi:pilus assembly protein CpaB